MPKIVRALGFSGSVQALSWSSPGVTPVRAFLWGGGGGGGGSDAKGLGGAGGGSGYSQVNFSLQSGDVITVAVGQAGNPGQSQTAAAAGGTAGQGLVSAPIWDTRSNDPSLPAVSSPTYGKFLDAYGVWDPVTTASVFDRTYTIFFPFSAEYTFTASAKNQALISVDGVNRFASTSSTLTYEQNITLTQGFHDVRIQAQTTSGQGAVALTIDSGISYSGARGGNAGASSRGGGGGGGGGATVMTLNSVLIALAAGGGGGGGGGRNSGGQNAPGPNGSGTAGQTAGENGENKTGSGGGGGGGGGGQIGGNGGDVVSGDSGGQSGNHGTSFGTVIANPSGVAPGGTNTEYYIGSVGRGGASGGGYASNGYAVFEFDLNGLYVRDAITFQPVEKMWVKSSGVWTPVQSVYVKSGGEWKPTLGATAPIFFTLSGSKLGINPRLNGNQTGGGGGSGEPAAVFDSRDAPGSYPVTLNRWSPFMNSHAVWGVGQGNTYVFSGRYNFPYSTYYTFTYAVDNNVVIELDNSIVITYSGFRANPPASQNIFVTAGFHTVSWTAVNTDGPKGVALTIVQDFS